MKIVFPKKIKMVCTLFLLLTILSISGCILSPYRSAPGSQETPIFNPPTYVPTQKPTSTPDNSEPTAAPITNDCQNDLIFISDITIPDGTAIQKGATLDKQWEVENSGSCNWSNGYQLRLLSGDPLGTEEIQALPPSRSGAKTIIQVIFTAPQETGPQHSVWQAVDPQGNLFGQPFYIDIMVID